VGKGAFGTVYLAKYRPTNLYVALKQLEKSQVLKQRKNEAVMREKALIKKLQGTPFVIELLHTFMDETYLYFVFEHC